MGEPDTVASIDLAECYRRLRVELVRLALLLSGSREAAEDAVQTVFADAQRRWDQIESHRSYLRRAVINRIKDTHRRSLRRRAVATPDVATGIPDVDETWHVICGLPAHQRDAVVLRFYEDLPLGEIAEVLGRNPATVRSDLRRALNRLKGAIS
jgi:RNA polymerase sigma factor (sigma-70 family)